MQLTLPQFGQKVAAGVEDLNAAVAGIGHENPPPTVNDHIPRTEKLARFPPLFSERKEELAAGREFLDTAVAAVDNEQIALRVAVHPLRTGKAAVGIPEPAEAADAGPLLRIPVDPVAAEIGDIKPAAGMTAIP
jgi:hypothetical protein